MPLLRAVLASPFKRPHPDAQPPTTHLREVAHVKPPHLAAYERVCGFATGRGRDDLRTLPPTYPHVLAFPLAMRLMSARDFPLPLLGLVHTSIDITQHHAVHPTEALELDVHVAQLAPHRRGTEATLATEARTTDGTLRWESRSTFLARHKTSAGSGRPRDGATPAGPGTDWHLASDLGRRYASVSGDRNPIHLHPLTARPFGFPRAIAHGMWTAARCLAAHEPTRNADPESPLHVHVEFKAPVPLPSTVTYTARGPAFELRATATGRTHLTGSSAVLP
ncbi:MaoC family dehydratase [Streptomyces formicae]|uniref:Acyl dehydratase n=1 Tax=Streptomyces formicae TaxID=1616117 RepID=A0A291QDI5_9ACTN|nr:MaoC/PaaZ C-terminal domain-containing protein [Streptomyces formicae]ATL29628.1 Acyl dehydratase [Streptomyces formicae]